MATTLKEHNPDPPTCEIYEIPGGPALVINGVPPVGTNENGGVLVSNVESEMDAKINESLGYWFDGRQVQKLFDGKMYIGKVTEFDKESGWYRVVYEDGDFEDLEWHELQQVLLPLDVTIPLKALALKVVKKRQKHDTKKSGRSFNKSQSTNPKD